jgi:predicted GIY-YIG superfamily endonuclease
MKRSWVYILHCSDGTFYTGCTTNLKQRIYQHKNGVYQGYTKKRRPVKLVWFEEFQDIREAIDIERKLKKWSAAKKRALIKNDFKLLHELAQSREMSQRRKTRENS